MNPLIESMQALQQRMRSGAAGDPAAKEIAALRARVPAPVLAHFDRLTKQGRKGVAEVRHGVCGSCHLKLPASMTARRVDHEDLQLCENCGAYLAFLPETVAAEAPVVRAPQKRRYRATAVSVAAAT